MGNSKWGFTYEITFIFILPTLAILYAQSMYESLNQL
jgi:hypothetical protein